MHQANKVIDLLRVHTPSMPFTIKPVDSSGDLAPDQPITEIGGKVVFVKRLEQALLNGAGRIAVHSLKDMSAHDTPGLTTVIVKDREDVRDVLILPSQSAVIPEVLTVATSSPRRCAQLRRWQPQWTFQPLRGNVPTRIERCLASEVPAVVLAAAGMHRLGLRQHITHYLSLQCCLPAPGQGLIAVQYRTDDEQAAAWCGCLMEQVSTAQALAERRLCVGLQADCHTPVAAYAEVRGEEMRLQANVTSLDGQHQAAAVVLGDKRAAASLAERCAAELLARGAQDILRGR
jgi:hydroxymethylbilane synthase